MLSTTLSDGLKQYRIGTRLRGLRLSRKMGLVELGRHTGLSPALLSKIERDKLFPTLPTLLRIAMVFSVGLDFFFSSGTPERSVALVRGKDRIRLPDDPAAAEPAYYFESLDFPAVERKTNAYFVEFEAASTAARQPHHHGGTEFIYVLKGKLELTIGEEEYVLSPDDSIHFESKVPHAYRRIGATPCTALVVTAP
jgi:quercetin dioxygenase-like cupin family protein/DNA-binding XRE family transcriptional regulator